MNLKKAIQEYAKPFIFYHTHVVTEETINESIAQNKSIDLDISVDSDGIPYLGHTEEYYEINGIQRPKTTPIETAIKRLEDSNIPIIVDCKHRDAWPIVEEYVRRLGSYRCLVHAFAEEFKFDYNKNQDHDYESEWSTLSKLKDFKSKFPKSILTASCKYLPDDLAENTNYSALIEEIIRNCVSNNIDTICLNIPDEKMNDEVLEKFLANNIIPHINIDATDHTRFKNLFVGETDYLDKATLASEINLSND